MAASSAALRMFQRKLCALEYPLWDKFDATGNRLTPLHHYLLDQLLPALLLYNTAHSSYAWHCGIDNTQYRTLIVWLEDSKIRFYKPDERTSLRAITTADWTTHFIKYLRAIPCTRPFKAELPAEDKAVVLDFLLSHAISVEFHDASDTLRSVARPAITSEIVIQPVPAGVKKAATFACNGPEFLAAIRELATLLQLPAHDGVEPTIVLQVIARRLREHSAAATTTTATPAKTASAAAVVPPGKKEKAPKIETKSSDQKAADVAADLRGAHAALAEFPLGFTTGDNVVDRAALVLRMLYISDLRDLQSLINECLVAIQDFTANPTTDSKLGKTGV